MHSNCICLSYWQDQLLISSSKTFQNYSSLNVILSIVSENGCLNHVDLSSVCHTALAVTSFSAMVCSNLSEALRHKMCSRLSLLLTSEFQSIESSHMVSGCIFAIFITLPAALTAYVPQYSSAVWNSGVGGRTR